jgi:hypothetical protein
MGLSHTLALLCCKQYCKLNQWPDAAKPERFQEGQTCCVFKMIRQRLDEHFAEPFSNTYIKGFELVRRHTINLGS